MSDTAATHFSNLAGKHEHRAAQPIDPEASQSYFRTEDDSFQVYLGSQWQGFGFASSTSTSSSTSTTTTTTSTSTSTSTTTSTSTSTSTSTTTTV